MRCWDKVVPPTGEDGKTTESDTTMKMCSTIRKPTHAKVFIASGQWSFSWMKILKALASESWNRVEILRHWRCHSIDIWMLIDFSSIFLLLAKHKLVSLKARSKLQAHQTSFIKRSFLWPSREIWCREKEGKSHSVEWKKNKKIKREGR